MTQGSGIVVCSGYQTILQMMMNDILPLVAPERVKDIMNQPGTVLIDARGGADAYERYQTGHIDVAQFVDLENDLSTRGPDASIGGRHPLPDPGKFGAVLGQVGIQHNSRVLVYDDKSGANAAARFWWMLRAAGHHSVQVIDGGYAAMLAVGLPVTQGPTATPHAGKPYPAFKWNLPVADLEMVDKARTNRDYLVIDVRENYRYRGESEPIDLVAGHIPGAVNSPYLDNLEKNGRFRPPEVLADQYKKTLAHRGPEKVIIHCGSGVTACHTLLAMEIAGISGAKLYTGSWSEWSRRDKPIAKGPNP